MRRLPATRHQTLAQPDGPVGFVRGTSVPGVDLETPPRELDSQAKRSRKRRPSSFRGARRLICAKISILAPCTPTAKNEKLLLWSLSPECTRDAACLQLSVGPPSVIRNTHGR